MNRFLLLYIPLSLLFSSEARMRSSVYPDSIKIPVIFYDFHSDLSNPEFENVPVNINGIWKGMVQEILDAQRKPVLGEHPYFNLDMAKWFRPWVRGDSLVPHYGPAPYPPSNAAGLPPPSSKVDYDTAFKNVVNRDTLTFMYIPGSEGTYAFVDSNFFPLDGRGLGSEGKAHNYSFSMELHWAFTPAPGQEFRFAADDEAWVFINDSLVMDLGGCHRFISGTVLVDNLGIADRRKVPLDVFYCERHTSQAAIQITTSLIRPPVDSFRYLGILLFPQPIDCVTITGGDSIVMKCVVYDDTGCVRPEFGHLIEWSLGSGNPAVHDELRYSAGMENVFYARSDWASDTVFVTFVDPYNALRIVRDSVVVRVVPRTCVGVLITTEPVDTVQEKTKQPSAQPSGGCGSGWGLAFIPPMWFRWSAWRNRKREPRK
jgi:fibro-slime domain-containing protein